MSELMPPSVPPDKPTTEIVIPDYCNTGVIFRVLFTVNAVFLLVSLLHVNGVRAGLLRFVESSVLVEWACLTSIFALCGLRRLLLATGYIHSMAPWAQRALCAAVPAVITGILISFLMPYDWFRFSYSYLPVADGMLLAGLFGLALQHYFELRARAFSPALVEARLQALQARIRPHFLFNSLNAVLSLIRKEPLRAETALEDLAELFRVSMRDARDMTTIYEEIRLCQQYLSIEKIRLGDRLQVEWDTSGITESELHSGQIATLMLQPLLENAVNYGVEPVPAPTLIQVRISCSLGTIDISVVNPVADNATGDVLAPSGNRMALHNIRERLDLLYDVEAQLTYGMSHGRFEVRLRFPYVRVKP
jgi:two-component system, LytTR family, sensor histidine kinase AlgZ